MHCDTALVMKYRVNPRVLFYSWLLLLIPSFFTAIATNNSIFYLLVVILFIAAAAISVSNEKFELAEDAGFIKTVKEE